MKEAIRSFFRPFDLPAEARKVMEAEDLLFIAENIRTTVVYHRFRAPGRSFRNKREIARGSLGISRKRIVGYAFRKRILHLPFHREETKSVKFSSVDGSVLVIAFDPGLFDPRREGSMEIRYHTPSADEAFALIQGRLN